MSDLNERSRYWLSPGIDVPTRSEILPGLRPMRGLYVHLDAGEAVFVPTDEFMRATPLWRLDVLGEIAQAIERTQRHAAVDYFRRINQRRPDLMMDQRLATFRRVCDEGGPDPESRTPRSAGSVVHGRPVRSLATNQEPAGGGQRGARHRHYAAAEFSFSARQRRSN